MTLRRIALAIALAAAGRAGRRRWAWARSRSNRGVDQPLLAEIPIISSDPAELEQLQARLASPETFRRVGLEPPSGAAADLQFSRRAATTRGRPVIRVTSTAPVSQPLVTFLIEVDWGRAAWSANTRRCSIPRAPWPRPRSRRSRRRPSRRPT